GTRSLERSVARSERTCRSRYGPPGVGVTIVPMFGGYARKGPPALHGCAMAHDRMRRTAPIGLARHGGRVRNRDRARVPRRALDVHEDVLRVPQSVRRPA